MQILNWLEGYVGSIDDAVVSANQLYWGIEVKQHSQRWTVQSGDQALLISDNRESVDAFLYGLALAYSILPDESLKVVREQVKEMMGFDPDEEEKATK